MAFTEFIKGDRINPTKMNDNFYHVGQGNLLPSGGNNLEETTSVYNLGSGVYRWDNVYANDVYLANGDLGTINVVYNLIASYEIDNTNTATSRIEFSVNSDDYQFCAASIFLPNQSTVAYMWLNGDSLTSNYYRTFIRFRGSTQSYNYSTPAYPVAGIPGVSTTMNCSYNTIEINIKSGLYKNIVGMHVRSGTEILDITLSTFTWINGATVTSLVLSGEFNTGASIKIWAIE